MLKLPKIILLLLIGGSFWGLHAKPPRILGGQSRKKDKLKKPPHEATWDPRWTLKKRIKLPTFVIMHT
jgi:hypothetical protein